MSTPVYGPPIDLAAAKRVVEAAEAEAVANDWAVVIAVVDSGGNLVVLHRMDNAQLGSIPIAQSKAATAVRFKRPSREFEDAVEAGGRNMRILAMEGLAPLNGGVPLEREGGIIGAVGVSGVLPTQDAQVAQAGADALGTEPA